MKTLFHLALACLVVVATVGCEPKATTTKKSESTVTTPGGETKSSVEEKVTSTPDSSTKTTTEKVETSGENPPANP